MSQFIFTTDNKSYAFCLAIAEEMEKLFQIPYDEAIGRINRQWQGLTIVGQDLIYHEDEEFWAKTIYYGKSSYWWLAGANPQPLPYP